jgi:geranylgeranylglycerol-phosphate geranylgeranyltransferase
MTMSTTTKISRTEQEPISFASGYIVTMRPYLLFVSGITGVAGMAFGPADSAARLVSAFLACFLSYGFGQALTDCFQTDTDALSSPYRPLPRGAISRRLTLAVSLAGLVACITVLARWDPRNLLLGSAAGAGLATYTWFKRRWWGGPWYNAWIVVLLFVMGGLAAGWTASGVDARWIWTAAGTFFGYANFVLAGYFKDVEADRATGYDTMPVRFGRRKAVIASHLLAAGLAASIAGLLASSGREQLDSVGGPIFLLASLLAIFPGQWNLHLNETDASAHRAVIPVIHAYVTFLAGVAALQRPGWFVPLVAFYAAFCFVISRRPERQQV